MKMWTKHALTPHYRSSTPEVGGSMGVNDRAVRVASNPIALSLHHVDRYRPTCVLLPPGWAVVTVIRTNLRKWLRNSLYLYFDDSLKSIFYAYKLSTLAI
jgi:hypothetical protein